MKLKTDFVTNSSSTAYIVLIPNNFHIEAGDIEISWDNVDENDSLPIEQIHKETLEIIEELKNGGNMWHYGNDGVHQEIYDTILDLCSENNFTLDVESLDGEGNNMVIGIKEKQVKDIIFNSINIDETFNFLKKESEDVKEK